MPRRPAALPAPDARERRLATLALAAVVLAAAAVYANTLWNGFVYDDRFQVIENRWLGDLSNIPRAFVTNVWAFKGGVSNYYRPWMHVSYILTHAVAGLTPWTFHLVNVLLHAGVTALVFAVARRVILRAGAEPRPAIAGALAAGLLFATHPIHTEVVAWVACVPDLLLGVFAAVMLLLHGRPGRGARAGAVASFFAGMFAKETMVTVPLLLVAWDLAFERPRPALAAWARRYVPYAIAFAVYLGIRFVAISELTPLRRYEELGPIGWAVNALPLFADYLRYLLVPTDLSAFHVFHPVSLFSARGLYGLAGTAAFVAATVWALRRDPPLFFALAVIALPLLPVLYIPAVGENTFTERYLYLPSIGFVLLAGIAVARLVARRPAAVPAALAAAGLVSVGYAALTVPRNRVWRDDYSLWSHTVADSPDSAFARTDLAIVLAERGQLREAIVQYEEALRLDPASARTHNNLAVAYENAGRVDLAVEHLAAALRLEPGNAKAHVNLGNTYRRLGRLDQAIEEYRRAVDFKPESVEYRISLGNALDARGDADGAAAEYRAALAADPRSADAHMAVGVASAKAGRIDEAIVHLETAVRLAPSDEIIRRNLAQAYRVKGDIRRAEELLGGPGR
jgi:tetratricopeptide (TPR) repeat protein